MALASVEARLERVPWSTAAKLTAGNGASRAGLGLLLRSCSASVRPPPAAATSGTWLVQQATEIKPHCLAAYAWRPRLQAWVAAVAAVEPNTRQAPHPARELSRLQALAVAAVPEQWHETHLE